MKSFEEKRQLFKQQLSENVQRLNSALDTLKYSLDKCEKIEIERILEPESMESLEALTARFARVSDILTQKVLKTIFLLLQERPGSFIDQTNRAEKLEIIPDATKLQSIRELRNEIAHEYRLQSIKELYSDVLENSRILIATIVAVEQYSHQHNLLPDEDNQKN